MDPGAMTDQERRLAAVVAANVRAERARLRMRQEQLAAALGVTRQAVGWLEAGERSVSLDQALALCRALDVPLSTLLHGARPEDLRALGLYND